VGIVFSCLPLNPLANLPPLELPAAVQDAVRKVRLLTVVSWLSFFVFFVFVLSGCRIVNFLFSLCCVSFCKKLLDLILNKERFPCYYL